MKRHPDTNFNFVMLCNAFMTLAWIALLQGCAASGPGTIGTGTAIVQPASVAAGARADSADAQADFEAGMQSVKAEDYEKAVALLSKAAKEAPENAVPSINLALVYRKLGKLKPAEEALKRATAAEPGNPVANNEYALLYRKTGRLAEARALYEKTLEQYPNFIMVHKNLGILCDLYMKDYDCALKHYRIYSSVMQDDKTVKTWIADVQNRAGK